MASNPVEVIIRYCATGYYKKNAEAFAASLREDHGVATRVIPGETGDFQVLVESNVVLDKKQGPGRLRLHRPQRHPVPRWPRQAVADARRGGQGGQRH